MIGRSAFRMMPLFQGNNGIIRKADDAIVSLNDAVNDALRDLIQVRKLIGFNRLGSHGDSKELSSLCPSF